MAEPSSAEPFSTPESLSPEPEIISPEPELSTSEPELFSEPETVNPEPELVTSEPEPEIINPEPEFSTSEPEHLFSEPESFNPEPEWSSSEPELSEPIAEFFTQDQITLWIILYTLWIVLIIALNIATIVSLVQAKVIFKKSSNVFLLSLIIARTAIAILVMPARITGLFSNELLGPVLCKLCHFCGQGSSGASIFSTCGVAVSKLIEVKYTDKKLTAKHGMYGVIIAWIAGFLYGTRAYVLNGLVKVNTFAGVIWACTADPGKQLINQVFIFVDLTVLFLVPLILILVCYCTVLKELKKDLHKNIVLFVRTSNNKGIVPVKTSNDKGIVPEETKTAQTFDSIENEREKIKGIMMLIGVMVAFIVCYAAVYVWKLYVFFAKVPIFTNDFMTIEQVVYLISYANPWVNVFIYVYFRKDIRSNFCSKCRRQTRSTSPLMK